ncbi:uncharacterized protein LOC108103278 [Drosophila eugracilis]|uniref:uncharacterized protein LOC108103278 n=1 Tax=Drosophila eugracilis TaxID=29029 RepID=UPI0007E7905E|nr:uncharacterized protein LOC108103278 [Drosophila eugracilis]
MASRINLGELKLVEIKSFCDKFGLSTKGSKAALVAQINAVLPSEIAPELYCEVSTGEIGAGMTDANAANNNNEEQDGEMAVANAANNNNEEQSEEEDDDVFGDEPKLVETVDRDGVQLEGNGVQPSAPTFGVQRNPGGNAAEMNLNTVRELLPEYNGDGNINEWLMVVKNVRDVFKVSNDVMRPLICSRLKGKANFWLLSRPSLLAGSIDLILAKLKIFVGTKDNVLEMRRKFENSKLQFGEKFAIYFFDKLTLAQNIAMSVHELVQYLIDGIQNVQLKNQAKLLRFAVPADMLEAFQDVEKPRAPVRRMQGTASSNAATPEQRVKCFNSHSLGHLAKDCRKLVRGDRAC